MTDVRIIAAISENNVIGNNNEIPWHIPEDLKRFKQLTMGNSVIMGRKTYESIISRLGHPLKGRKNIVLSRNNDFKDEGIIVARTIDEALDKNKDNEIAYVIGGESIYNDFIPFASLMEITRVHKKVEGDAFFPEINWGEWVETFREDKKGYSFITYKPPRLYFGD